MALPMASRVRVCHHRAAVGAVALFAGAMVLVVLRPRRVIVEGRSMEPALAPGDRLVVVRAMRLRPGDVVAVRDPRYPRRLLVKRVSSAAFDEIVVHGDNAAESTDSRAFGAISRRAVVGRVVHRYQQGAADPAR
jgi:nickel-type superoxide dismutase maturation protease